VGSCVAGALTGTGARETRRSDGFDDIEIRETH